MIKELIQKNRYSFHEKFNSWDEAVKASCQPLIKEGVITEEYIQSIIDSINEHGPYIVIAPNICIPHAQQGKGVRETAIAFMKSEEPVHFGDSPEYDAKLFFVLASTDNEKHLKNLSELVEILSDETIVNKLLLAKTEKEFIEIFE